ncbi:unnamed protein product, partial [marine sediment metagenome]
QSNRKSDDKVKAVGEDEEIIQAELQRLKTIYEFDKKRNKPSSFNFKFLTQNLNEKLDKSLTVKQFRKIVEGMDWYER